MRNLFLKFLIERKFKKGMFYYQSAKYSKAIDIFSDLIHLRKDPEFYQFRGLCYLFLNKIELAIKDLSKSICLDPDIPDYYYNRGYIYSESKQFDKAINDYKKCISLDKSWFEAYYACAYDFFQMKRFTDAAEYYSKFLDCTSEPAAIQLYNAALSFIEIGDHNRTKELMIKSADLGNIKAKEYIRSSGSPH